MRKAVSKDGTTIAYKKTGEGPPVVFLGGGFRDHTAFDQVLPVLAPHVTAYTYDRRGRGESGDAPTYAIEREIEDIEALIAEAGGQAAVFGGSSGGILALEAAMAGAAITKLLLLEPPYWMDMEECPWPPDDFTENLRALLAQERRGDAAEYFLAKMAYFSPEEIARWRAGPMWAANEAMAHTLAYDTVIITEHGRRLPVERMAAMTIPTLVINSEMTSAWLLAAAQATAAALPNSRGVTLPGVWHKVSPEILGQAVVDFVAG